jgi:hypothetical protein
MFAAIARFDIRSSSSPSVQASQLAKPFETTSPSRTAIIAAGQVSNLLPTTSPMAPEGDKS